MDRFPVVKKAMAFAMMGTMLILGVIGAVVVVAYCEMAAFGEEIPLFAPTAFESPINLFPIEQPATQQIPDNPITLFEAPAISSKIEQADLSRNQPKGVLFAWHLAKPPRPYLVAYCPPWCGPCDGMCRRVGKGDDRIRIRFEKGDASTFPDFIREYASHNVWPVLHWVSPSGKPAMFHGVKTLDELVELANTEPGEVPKRRQSRSAPPEATVSLFR